jgi:hypothetical protein
VERENLGGVRKGKPDFWVGAGASAVLSRTVRYLRSINRFGPLGREMSTAAKTAWGARL